MARCSKATFNFKEKDDYNLTCFVSTVIVSMTDNANFKTPSPALTVITTANEAFLGAILAAAHNEHNALMAAKDHAREVLETLLVSLASYVSAASNFDAGKILSSGFIPSGQLRPAGLGHSRYVRR